MANLTSAQLDDILDQRKLRLLPSLGDLSKGEPQLIHIVTIHDYIVFTDIVFRQEKPTGGAQNYVIRFNQNSDKGNGSVFVILLNRRYFLFVEQFRPAIGQWILETGRGLRESEDESNEEVMYREAGEEALGIDLASALNKVATHLGDIYEFTGTHNVVSSHYLFEATIQEERLPLLRGSEPGIRIVLMEREELERERSGFGRFRDNFSLTAIGLALGYLDRRAGFWAAFVRLLKSYWRW